MRNTELANAPEEGRLERNHFATAPYSYHNYDDDDDDGNGADDD